MFKIISLTLCYDDSVDNCGRDRMRLDSDKPDRTDQYKQEQQILQRIQTQGKDHT